MHISNAVSKFTATAFAGCTSLMEINIPDSMTDVPRGLFKVILEFPGGELLVCVRLARNDD